MHGKMQQATVHCLVLTFFIITLILVAACTSVAAPELPDKTTVANAGTNTAGTANAEEGTLTEIRYIESKAVPNPGPFVCRSAKGRRRGGMVSSIGYTL
jgi:hypothetical protein